ncbi:MAG: NAD-specific glutamate dehydrogenase [Chlamydiae bacterium]|nr:NAD-specific glutamate dehydrogenase [Chlamydiota bacterium]
MAKKKKPGSGEDLKEHLADAVRKESRKCEECYVWLEQHMPPSFFEEVSEDDILLIAHSLMGFDLQDFFAHIHLKDSSIVLCLDSMDADLRILKHYQMQGIKDYRAFVSNESPPFPRVKTNLRVAIIYFTMAPEVEETEKILDPEEKKEIRELVKARNPEVTDAEFRKLLAGMSPRFLRSMPKERLSMAFDMFFRAQSRNHCQYEVRYNKDWKKKKDLPSMQVVFAWRNVPKHHFLYNLARVVHRHNLTMRRVSATYINPYSKDSVLIMSIGLHGEKGQAAWDACDTQDFLQELVTLKYFEGQQEIIEKRFVDTELVRGNIGNLIKAMSNFIHQTLTHADVNMYSLGNIEEGLCRHPELTILLTEAFEYKFDPEGVNLKKYENTKKEFLKLVADLDTGNEANDTKRKNILRQGMNFVEHTLKTNFYRNNKSAFCFRLDPIYLDYLPYDRKEKFPELPFSIFFTKGMYFIGFHIRFKELSRGGLRTVFPQKMEQMLWERNIVFAECYNLAYTQQKKNKDIPEGGAKGVIFLEPFERLQSEIDIYKEELKEAGLDEETIKEHLVTYKKEQKLEYLYSSQRSFIEAFITLLNCDADGKLRAKHIVDYWKKPEYIYLGPDENMHNEMIEWIARHSTFYDYKPRGSFISSKPSAGINHKEYGVTSLGVNVYMEEALKYLGIDPYVDSFTIKISGGPDGDVAGNQLLNLYKFFPKTAKLLALTDISGTIYDPKGLDLKILAQMFHDVQPICNYPPNKLNDGGFLLDLTTKREQTAYAQQTLCWRKKKDKVIKDWLSGNEMNHLFSHNVHQAKTDIFIPGGGRPRTLNEHNYKDFLDETGHPTSKAIVEGANLYLTPWARRALEKLGVLIIKDSSANKGGVTCSSFEVLTSLILSEEEFIEKKPELMPEILAIIRDRAKDEAQLLLTTHAETGAYLTDISEWISEKINTYMYQLLDYLEGIVLSDDPKNPLIRCLLNYCPPLLCSQYKERIITDIPDIHKKAIIATYIASKIVYSRGLEWSPTIVDILPIIATDPDILED